MSDIISIMAEQLRRAADAEKEKNKPEEKK